MGYPVVRIHHAPHETLIGRDGVSICFYMRHSHEEMARGVKHALETFLRAVGPQALAWYPDSNGDWQELDDKGRQVIQHKLCKVGGVAITLAERPDAVGRYQFDYSGINRTASEKGDVSRITFWLPTEYLEQHGAQRVRELALELGSQLPFNSGHAGLAFLLLYMPPELRPLALRHPGMDISGLPWVPPNFGTHVQGAHWLTFLGQPVLGELGGAAGLRSRFTSPDITVQELEGERAVITLGTKPEAGDTEQGHDLPLYRELAHVLEPWLYHHPPKHRWAYFSPEDMRRWERRFLD
jgi:TseV toxin immunity protein TsiV